MTTDLFIPIIYKTVWRDLPGSLPSEIEVSGYAFETPGWPEVHACVQLGRRDSAMLFDEWIIDHFETGLAITCDKPIHTMEEAPYVLAAKLNKYGRPHVAEVLRRYGIT